jgi:hypothetical protein
MNKFKVLFFVCLPLFSVFFMSNSGGRPDGNAGAPGEDGVTCENCHIRGPFEPIQQIIIKDLAGQVVTSYQKGVTYTLEARVGDKTGKARTFGFQLTALNKTNVDQGNWSALGSRVKIVNSLGRRYLSHSSPSTTGIFTANWTVPTTTTGEISLYFAAVTADGNGGSIGDNAIVSVVKISDMTTSISEESLAQYSIFPTQTSQYLNVASDGKATITITNLLGIKMIEKTIDSTESIDVSGLSQGMFLVTFQKNQEVVKTMRFMKE